ncbi:MAG TPA: tetratricopeptide repeat protein [Candidatus Tectomicrobia bacterium]|nr:tetratricopeptide repeat protein [Candidatus Tectomicrobia bacterium]
MSCKDVAAAAPSGARRRGPATARDARGVPVSCADPSVLALYEQALVQYQSYVGDPIATIEEALRHAPDFVLGHAFRATVLMTLGERRFAEQARVSVGSAEVLLDHATPRERQLVAAARRLVDGAWGEACALLDRVLVEHPRDAFAIQSAHLMDFFRGDSLNLRNRISRVLPHWSPAVPGYSYILGMHAFGLEECNQYPEAEEAGRRALALQPRDAWAVHAVTHVMEMQGRIDEGIAWLESREADWAPDNGFAYHNYWHLALYYLDRQRYADALALYDRRLHAEPPDLALQLVDATALLWRLHLEGVDVGGRADLIADNWAKRLDTERGFYAFNDAHAMMAFAMAGREAEAARLLADVEWSAEHAQGTNRMMAGEVGLPVCRALHAFGRGRHAEAIALLEPVRDVAARFGGSHAQRDLLTLTLIEAALRDGQQALARHYIAERTVHKPASAWGWRLLARATRHDTR